MVFIIHKKICDNFTFKHNEVLMDKPIYVGFVISELIKLHKNES